MSIENETWRESSNEESHEANREGNREYYNRDGYNNRRDDNRSSFNRENNYNREGRSYNSYGSERSSYGDRPQRPRFVRDRNESSDQRSSYNRYDRPQQRVGGGYNRDGGSSYNRDNNYNREGGSGYNRDSGSSYNRDGGSRPYRPRINRDNNSGGYNRTDRPQRPYNPNYNKSEDRPYNREERPWNNGGERRPWQSNNSGSSYGRGGDDRPRRPRFTPGGGDNKPQGFARPVRRTGDYDPNAKYSKKKQIEYKEQFIDPNEPIRLNKYLANAGVCSRREADEFITAGVVSVNGEVVTELGTKIKRSDVVKFHEETVSVERKIYILLNKPKDCVTTSDDPQSRQTVMDLVKDACTERIYPVGRLDRNTTGVLLLTNDGDLASKLTHPKFLKKKIYHVFADKNVTKSDMEQIAAGVKLENDEEVRADAISYIDDVKRNQVGIEIHSGQNRIVRRIFESLGYRVIRLDRVYFAGLTKKGLRRGDWRYLTENEVNYLRMGSFN